MAEFRTDITANTEPFTAAHQAMVDKYITETQRMQSNMREAFAKISDSASETFKKMNGSFDGFVEGMGKIRGVFAAVTAVLAGGAMFGKMISDSAKATAETVKLSKILGITTEAASTLRTALGLIGMGADEYTAAVGKMTMKLREGEERFHELGIATRGSNNELLSGEDVMQNSLQALLKFKEGTDRNLAATEIFGKGWVEVMGFLKLTPALMEAARQKAEELETVVGPEGAARALAYKLAMNEVKEVFAALANRVGQALMPILTQLGEWFASIGPAAVVVMRGAIGAFAAAFWGLKMVVEIVWESIKIIFKWLGTAVAASVDVMSSLLRWDFSGAKRAWQLGLESMSDAYATGMKTVIDKAEANRGKLMALFDPTAEQGASAAGGKGGKSYRGKTTAAPDAPADKSRMSQWDADLAAQRDAYDKQKLEQGSFQQFSIAMERDFWKKILDTVAMTADERAAASKKFYAAELQLRKQAFDAEIADIKERIARHKAGSIERIGLAGDAAVKIVEKYDLESKEYRQALGEMSKMAEERGKQQIQLESMVLERTKESKVAVIELERQALDDAEKLGLISADKKLVRLKQLKELEYQIELQALTDTAVLYDMDELAYQGHLDKIAKLKEKHAADVRKLDGQMALESKKNVDAWFDPIGNGFQKLMDGMIQGTQTWSQAIRKTFLAVGAEFASLGVKMAVAWLKKEVMQTQATAAGVASRTAAEEAGATQSVLLTAWAAIKNIGAAAWEAAAAVYQSIASIPYVGPFLAPVMAVAAAGVVLGFASNIASAEGGYSVPRGVSPVTQLHPEEMVLPAHLANAVRGMAGDDGGRTGGDTLNLSVNTIDDRGFKRLLMDNKSAFAEALKSAYRDGKR